MNDEKHRGFSPKTRYFIYDVHNTQSKKKILELETKRKDLFVFEIRQASCQSCSVRCETLALPCAMPRSRSFVGFLRIFILVCACAWVYLATHGPRAHAQATYGEFLRRQRKHEEHNKNNNRGRGRGSSDVVLELLSDAPKAGAVCLDGSPPGYYYRPGYGTGENRFLIFIGR